MNPTITNKNHSFIRRVQQAIALKQRMIRLGFHHHKWTTTRTNPYQIPTEQQCTSCHSYRHHTAADLIGVPMGGEPKWKLGRHPAEKSQ